MRLLSFSILPLFFSLSLLKQTYAQHSLSINTDGIISLEGTLNIPQKFPIDGSRSISITVHNSRDFLRGSLQSLNWHVESSLDESSSKDFNAIVGVPIKFAFFKKIGNDGEFWTISTNFGSSTFLNYYPFTQMSRVSFAVEAGPNRWVFGNIAITGVSIKKPGTDTTWCLNAYEAGDIDYRAINLQATVEGGIVTCSMDQLLLIKKE